ncbi:MAG: hypothetical protein ABEH86_13595 [Haloarcula sp.]
MQIWVRAAIVLALCLVLSGLFVHAEVTEDARSPYPDAEDLTTEYNTYLGQKALIFGTVTETSEGVMTIRSESDGKEITLQVTGADLAVEPGGVVQVYGTLKPDRTITAERIKIVNSSRWAELYKYGTSAVGALGFVVLFFRYWRIDSTTWTLEGRDG